MQTFKEYENSIDDHYSKIANSISNNNNMSMYIDYLTGYNGTQTTFNAPPSKFINMSKAPSNEKIPLVVCTNDKGVRDSNGKKIITKPFTWFVNNNNQFDLSDNERNNNLLDNIIKNDSDLYKDSYLSNILNTQYECIYRGGSTLKESNDSEKRLAAHIKILRANKPDTTTKADLDLQIYTKLQTIPWIKNKEYDHLQKLGKYKFKDPFSNYQERKKLIGLTYFTSLSIILLIIIYRLK